MFDIPNRGLEFSYQIAGSNLDNIKGYGASIELDYKSTLLEIFNNNVFVIDSWLRYDNYDKEFNIDYSGYLYRNNLKSYNYGVSFNLIDPKYVSSSVVTVKFLQQYNLDKVVLDDMISIDWGMDLNNNWLIALEASSFDYSYTDRLYDEYFYSTYFQENLNSINIKNPSMQNYAFKLRTDERKLFSIGIVCSYSKTALDDDGKKIILSTKLKLSKYLDVEIEFYNNLFSNKYNFLKIKKISNPLQKTKEVYKERNKFDEKELKEFSILFLVMKNLDIFRKNIELISKASFSKGLANDFKKEIIDYLLSEKFFDKKEIAVDDFDSRFKNLINIINEYAPIKIIYKNKNEDDIVLMFNEILEEIKKIELKKKIESLEHRVSSNLDENLYTELLTLRNQLKGG